MPRNSELLKQLREILEPPTNNPLANDTETKLRMLEKFINARYIPRDTHHRRLNGLKHQALKSAPKSTNDKEETK